ncbi:hypothetical protein CYF26_16410 [Salmonella enterica]|nr:hypothetical protein [Salmonella enterica]EDR1737314.1 hypothetical protein [Salmonella enterica subsp. diarizonae]EDT8255562.1 hypothetical protein [Salmonella enterica subsp. diarizonae serovar 48:z52:z]EDX6243652.1 hypothetical protein [Salmonella enterica subsp. diarizonae]
MWEHSTPNYQHSLFCCDGRWCCLCGQFVRWVMNKAFELWVRQRYGNRYDLTRDDYGFYCREVVKRMFEVWCHCRGLNVV